MNRLRLILPLLLLIGCTDGNAPAKLVGTVAAKEISSFTRLANDPIAGTYRVAFKNTTGRDLTEAKAKIFLFHDFSETYDIVDLSIGSIPKGEEKKISWDFPASKLAHEIDAMEKKTNSNARTYYHLRVPQRFLVYVCAGSEVYQITFSEYDDYLPRPDGSYDTRMSTLQTSEEVKKYMLRHGVPLPQ